MDIVYARGQATAADVTAALIDQSQLSDEDFQRLSEAIDKARKEGR